MNDIEKITNDITVVINENEETYSGRSGNNSGRSGLPAAAKLIALWSPLFGLVVGIPFIIFYTWLNYKCGTGAANVSALLFVCAHTAASAVSFKRYKRKYGVSVWKFVLLNVLPLFALGAVLFVAAWTVGFWEGILFAVVVICYGVYPVVYGVLLTAILGIGHLIERKKS